MKKMLLCAAVAAIMPVLALNAAPAGDKLVPGTQKTPAGTAKAGKPIAGAWICVFNASVNHGAQVAAEAQRAVGAKGKVTHTYGYAVKGFAAQMTEQAAASIKQRNPNVAYCEQDQVISTSQHGAILAIAQASSNSQTTPWGITRVNGGASGSFARAWVIDTGIQSNHPDLNVDTSRSRSFLSTTTSYQDGNGHGTHVAGTIAARNNTFGVIGVAPGAPVVALRVLGSDGTGSNSGVIAAVDWVARYASAGDVVNMSLGGGTSTTLDNAVYNASQRGIYFALAAGNESTNANYSSPGRVNGTYIWTVSAFDSADRFASFSNYGNPPVDVSEPGVSITSTWINSGYATISGTSMATPHLAGLILQRSIRLGGYVKNDPDGSADPIGVR